MGFNEEWLRAQPGFDPAFHLGETAEPAVPPPADDCSEADFQARVIALARKLGWFAFHPHDSRRSEAGWPDLALCRPPRLILAELKSADGKLSGPQKKWFGLLSRCDGVEAYCWWPRDWPAIQELLK